MLSYDFEPDAPDPERWLKFLGQIWPDDQQSIDSLQEWMGLQLVPDLRYEKIAAFIGPRRAGKGTISEIMSAMVGVENCAGPTLSSLSQNFGMQSLVGKLSAIIDDARLSAKSDQAVIAERLLSISGGGRLTVDRKYRDEWIGKVSARITLISNELPRLADASGALASRFIIFRFTKTFIDREDLTLNESLKPELPGIFRWAVAGWKRLRDRGRFIQPRSGLDDSQMMRDLASPILAFVEERCTVEDGSKAHKSSMYRAWVSWCENNGRREPGLNAAFYRDLKTAVPGLRQTEHAIIIDGTRERAFLGVRLKSPEELDRDFEPGIFHGAESFDVSGIPF